MFRRVAGSASEEGRGSVRSFTDEFALSRVRVGLAAVSGPVSPWGDPAMRSGHLCFREDPKGLAVAVPGPSL